MNNEEAVVELSKEDSFEVALKKLETLVQRMEAGQEDLDSMVKSFEEGRKLVDFCNRKLSAVERKIEKLTRQADGSVKREAFAEEAE